MKKTIYETYMKEYSIKAKKQDRLCLVIAFIKFVCLCFFLYMLYHVAFVSQDSLYLYFVLLGLILSIIWFVIHASQLSKLDYYKQMIHLNENYIKRIQHEWVDFKDNGMEFEDYDHMYSSDLDLFGKKSLYQYINVTHTRDGKERFVEDLCNAKYNEQELALRQAAIEELSQLDTFTLNFEYHAKKIMVHGNTKFTQRVKEAKKPSLPNFFYGFRFLPIISVSFLLLWQLFSIEGLKYLVLILLGLQVLIWAMTVGMAGSYFSLGKDVKAYFQHFISLFELVEKEIFKSERLRYLQKQIIYSEQSAAKQIKNLNVVIQMIEARANVLLVFVLNVFGLMDLWSLYLLKRWLKQNIDLFDGWFASLAEIESLLSFACFTRVQEQSCMPTIVDTKHFEASELGHPLLKSSDVVYNDVNFDQEIMIISGSNMSGKTTFLRTIGINLVLAQNGARVCAKNMTTPIYHLVTSMRIRDDLGEGISTFYQELRKIKAIVSMVEEDEQALFLIDEIFKGTNSIDRIDGSKKIIHRLYKKGSTGFLTTHDLAMCTYDDDTVIRNWHFDETIEGNEMHFDYKIKKGIATTTNGEFLMRMLSLID